MAFSSESSVVDNAKVFTDEAQQTMEELLQYIAQKFNIDVIIITTIDIPNQDGDESITQKWADEYYESIGAGFDEQHSGAVYVLDMNNRFNYISTSGLMLYYLTNVNLERVLSCGDPFLNEGNYGMAYLAELFETIQILEEGIQDLTYTYDESGNLVSVYMNGTVYETQPIQ